MALSPIAELPIGERLRIRDRLEHRFHGPLVGPSRLIPGSDPVAAATAEVPPATPLRFVRRLTPDGLALRTPLGDQAFSSPVSLDLLATEQRSDPRD